MQSAQRNTRKTHPCYVCGGYRELSPGRGQRCHGYVSGDGRFQYCAREQAAGPLPANAQGLYVHRLDAPCKCGAYHDTAAAPRSPLPAEARTPSTDARAGRSPIAAVYDYVDPAGELLYQVVRHEDKSFACRNAAGEYSTSGIPRVLYNLDLLKAQPEALVFLAEGEKDADALTALGLLATTSPHGAGGWRDEYAQALAGRRVVLLPDNDEPGRAHMARAAASLAAHGASVRTLSLPGLPAKGDVSDYLAAGGGRDSLLALVMATAPEPVAERAAPDLDEGAPEEYGAPEEPPPPRRRRFKSLKMFEMRELKPARWLIENVLEERSVVLLFGEPGSAKSFITLDWVLSVSYGRNWFGRAVRTGRVLYIAAENPHGYVGRIQAWMASRKVAEPSDNFHFLPQAVNLCDAGAVEDLLADHPGEWALIVVDTLANSIGGADENGQGDMNLAMQAARRISHETGATVVLVHHPAKGQLTSPRGTSVIPGFADTQIAVSKPADIEIHCQKMRNGRMFEDIFLSLKTVELPAAADEDGLIPTSCYLTFAQNGANATRLEREERAVLRALCSTQGPWMTRRELMPQVGLDERALFATLEKLSYAGLVAHEGWSRTNNRRYKATPWGAKAIGATLPDPEAAANPAPVAPSPPASCPVCEGTDWDREDDARLCRDCGTVVSA